MYRFNIKVFMKSEYSLMHQIRNFEKRKYTKRFKIIRTQFSSSVKSTYKQFIQAMLKLEHALTDLIFKPGYQNCSLTKFLRFQGKKNEYTYYQCF